MNKDRMRYTTQLNWEQINNLLRERNDIFRTRWNIKKNSFYILRKSVNVLTYHIPIYVKVKGHVVPLERQIQVELQVLPAFGISDLLLFIVPTFLILLYTGREAGASTELMLIVLGLITVWAFIMVNFWTKFSKQGKKICSDTIKILERLLELEANE